MADIEGNIIIDNAYIADFSDVLIFRDAARGEPVVTIYPPVGDQPGRVELHPDHEWEGAAKTFWNTVYKLVGQAPPFGW